MRYDIKHKKTETHDGHSYWQKIGVAFTHKKGDGFTLQFDFIPTNWDGRCAIFPAENRKPRSEVPAERYDDGDSSY